MSNLMKKSCLILMATLLILSLSSATLASIPERNTEALQGEYPEGVKVPCDEWPDYVKEFAEQNGILNRSEATEEHIKECQEVKVTEADLTAFKQEIAKLLENDELSDIELEKLIDEQVKIFTEEHEIIIIPSLESAFESFIKNNDALTEEELEMQTGVEQTAEPTPCEVKGCYVFKTPYEELSCYDQYRHKIDYFNKYECLICGNRLIERYQSVLEFHYWGDPMVEWNTHRWYVDCMICKYRNWLDPEVESIILNND